MNDLISRQAAIDAMRYAQHRFTVADEAGGMGTVKWSEDVIYFAAAERVLTELPSAQPEVRTEMSSANDTISRQAAIDEVINLWADKPFGNPALVEIKDCIEALPSAQPERTETHSCDYQRTEKHDLVSRRAALEAMDTWDKFGCDPDGKLVRYDDDKHYVPYVHYEDMVHAVKNLPSAQPKWTPVSSESMPEDGVTVWVTINGHDVIRCEEGETLEQAVARIGKIRWVTQGYWSEEEHGWNDPSFGCPLMVQPIAWMPMEVPEPYKGGTR